MVVATKSPLQDARNIRKREARTPTTQVHSKVDSVVRQYGPLLRNPSNPAMTLSNHKTGAHSSEPFRMFKVGATLGPRRKSLSMQEVESPLPRGSNVVPFVLWSIFSLTIYYPRKNYFEALEYALRTPTLPVECSPAETPGSWKQSSDRSAKPATLALRVQVPKSEAYTLNHNYGS